MSSGSSSGSGSGSGITILCPEAVQLHMVVGIVPEAKYSVTVGQDTVPVIISGYTPSFSVSLIFSTSSMSSNATVLPDAASRPVTEQTVALVIALEVSKSWSGKSS